MSGSRPREMAAAAAAEEHSGRIAGWLGVPHTRKGTGETQAEAEQERRGRREASAVGEREEMDLSRSPQEATGKAELGQHTRTNSVQPPHTPPRMEWC